MRIVVEVGIIEAMRSWLALVLLGPVAAACADPSPGDGSATEIGEGTATLGTRGSSSGAPPGPPEVIDVGFDQLVLREGEAVVLTAVIVDPDDDVVGAELHGPGEPARYGTLQPHPSDRWRVTVSWDDVHQRWPLDFTEQVQLPLVVRARDAAGHEAEASISLSIVCTGLRTTACDGVCVDVQSDDMHCGGCDQACTSGGCLVGTCRPR